MDLTEKELIFIVDDEERIRRMLRDFLISEGYEIIESGNGLEAAELFAQNKESIRLVILDLMLPGQNGFEVLKEIRKSSNVPVIMLTARGEEYVEVHGLRQGADDYIAKPVSLTLLLAHMEAVLKRYEIEQERILRVGNLYIYREKMQVEIEKLVVDFSPKEYELLLYMADRVGVALTREQILKGVWGYDYMGDTRTVDTHIKQLRGKLKDATVQINSIYGVGYKFEETTDEIN
jgi:DNA-binding response OmpR family regulator